ncbi:unnamed protein product [Rotaria sordida]|uniref:Choline transporter-like protein n=1 Tax=Rotaria sordida TaxID=392033 RepID=A0A818MXJ2_9BILA|nr:unnamed protein product [Rotaria sordida]CAF3608278.1 unnamed protein product [Rotaria sordida]
MADKALLGDTVVTKSYPIETNIYPKTGNEAVPIIDEPPPPYQSPQIDFSGGWKDRAFAILFYIHIVLVIVVGLALGIPAILPYFKDDTFTELRQTSTSSTIERLVGYLNEWAFIYSAITSQTYVEASRTFIELFKKRGWTLIINDTLIGTTMLLLNIVVGLASAAAGGVIVYFVAPNRSEEIITADETDKMSQSLNTLY